MAAQVDAVILAGGMARRMGGNDKGLVELRNQPMIKHARGVKTRPKWQIARNLGGIGGRWPSIRACGQHHTVAPIQIRDHANLL